MEKILSTPDQRSIYTDGSSNMHNRVDFGIYVPKYNYEFKSRISDFLSIYTDELTAIKFPLIWLLENNIQENTTIY